jgi:integrase
LSLDRKLFLNNRGRPWTGFAVKNRFEDVEVAIGLAEMKRRGIESSTEEAIQAVMATLPKTRRDKGSGKEVPRKPWQIRQQAKAKLVVAEAKRYGARFHHFELRHAFVTRKLVAGVDSHVVAALAGHRDTGMIDKVYSHVADDHEFMLREAAKDVSPKKDA